MRIQRSAWVIVTVGLLLPSSARAGFTQIVSIRDSLTDVGNTLVTGYLFWDDVRPTTAGQRLIADAAFNTVPGPSSVALFACGAARLLAVYENRPRRARSKVS